MMIGLGLTIMFFFGLIAVACLILGFTPRRKKPEPPTLFHNIQQVHGKLVYRTDGATILAAKIDHAQDSHSIESASEEYLLKSPNGRYFIQSHALFVTGRCYEHIYPYTKTQAIRTYNAMPDKKVSFAEAFGEELQEA